MKALRDKQWAPHSVAHSRESCFLRRNDAKEIQIEPVGRSCFICFKSYRGYCSKFRYIPYLIKATQSLR